MTDAALDGFLRFTIDMARDAGAILHDRFGQPHEVHYKGIIDVVTEADRTAEALIAARLREVYVDHDLLGEEGSRGAGTDSPYRWVIDPLDGTTNFAHGLPTFAVSIALEERGEPIVGVVYDPMRDEMFAARRGGGAILNGEPIRVSSVDRLLGGLTVTGFSYDLAVREHQAETWRRFLTRVQAIRQTGSSALNLAYIAASRLDGYWEWGILPWDVAAGALLVTEAGGMVTDMSGGAFRSDNRAILASNGALHAGMIGVINGAPNAEEDRN
jgi:myo-inositol-1(or 4)-monophosphatase